MKFLNVLNRFVSVVLVCVALTAALQFGGVASHSKDSADFEALSKGKSDYATDVIDSIFNIPIAALSAVSELVQVSEPLLKKAAEDRAIARHSRAELLKARTAERQSRHEAKASRRTERNRPVYVIKEEPIVVIERKAE